MMGQILALAVLSLQLWLVGSQVSCCWLVGEAMVRGVLLPAERSLSNSITSGTNAHCRLRFIWHLTMSEYGTRPFYGEAIHELRLICGRCRNSWPHWYSPFKAPQAPNNKLSPTSKQETWGQPPEAKIL